MSGISNGAFGQLRKKADSTDYDLRVARRRVDDLEQGVGELMRQALYVREALGEHRAALNVHDEALKVLARPFWGRVLWLLRGK